MAKFKFSVDKIEKLKILAKQLKDGDIKGCYYGLGHFIGDLESLFDGKYLVDRDWLKKLVEQYILYGDMRELNIECFDRLLKEAEEK